VRRNSNNELDPTEDDFKRAEEYAEKYNVDLLVALIDLSVIDDIIKLAESTNQPETTEKSP